MIANCVNPACRAPFSHKRDGRVFTVEGMLPTMEGGAARPSEQYWLCGTCSLTLKVVVENGRITTVPVEQQTATLAG
jgi:hypothetical protein